MSVLTASQLTFYDVTDGEISFSIYSQGLDSDGNITLKAVATESGKEVTNGQYRWYRYVATTEIVNDDVIMPQSGDDLDNISDSSFQVCKHIVEDEEQEVIQSTMTTMFKENDIYKCEFSYSTFALKEGSIDEELWKDAVACTAYFNVNTRRMIYTSLPYDGLYVTGDLWFVGDDDFKITGSKGDEPIVDSNGVLYALTIDEKPVTNKVYYIYDVNTQIVSVATILDDTFDSDVNYYEVLSNNQVYYKQTMLIATMPGNGIYKSSDWTEAFDFNKQINDTNNRLDETDERIENQQEQIDGIRNDELAPLFNRIKLSEDGGMTFVGGSYTENAEGQKIWNEGPFSSNFNSKELSFSYGGKKTAWISGDPNEEDQVAQFCVNDAAIVNTLDSGGSVSGTGSISVYSSTESDSNALVIQAEANGSFSFMIDNSPRRRDIPELEVN